MKLKTMVHYVTLFFKILIWLTIFRGKTGHHHHWKSHRSRHISGSHPAPPGRWNFMALLIIDDVNKTQHACSAILISQQSLLTAAHCCINATKITILFKGMPDSALKLKRHDVLFRTTDFNHVKFHPMYSTSDSRPFDIAIVKLRSALQLDPKNGLDKIELSPSKSEAIGYSYDPHDCYLLGYGLETPQYSDMRLQQAKIPILSNKYCRMWMSDLNAQLQVCLGYERKYSKKEVPKSSMPGDSGGAIVCKTRRMARSQSERYPRIPKYCLVAVTTGAFQDTITKTLHFSRKYIIMTVGVRINPKLYWIQMNM